MIASAIAYGMCAVFAILGIVSLAAVLGNKLSEDRIVAQFIVGMIFLSLSWGCAFLGGI